MNTEITDAKKLNGLVLYDADCGICVRLARRFQHTLARRRFELLPLQTPWIRARLGLPEAELLAEMRLLTLQGDTFGGADALLEIGRHFWWSWPLRQIARMPAGRELFRAAYRWIARNRTCATGACQLPAQPVHYTAVRAFDYLPLLALPAFALLCRPHLAPSVFMWAMAFALYAGCKWLTYRLIAPQPDRLRALAYLLAWPGMDAAKFLDLQNQPAKPKKTEWAIAVAKTVLGAMLLWAVARHALPAHPLLCGWIGMIGAIFVLHFGTFHLLSLCWRQAGVNAVPLMQNPLRATSLTEFWGARWNTAFNELAFRFTFRPLRRIAPPAIAMLVVFVLSGLIHELVISLPARGGHGLPTLYFLAQGLGIVTERSRLGRRLGLGLGIRGWTFTVVITAGPAFWLFHPPFIHHVILPMFTAIGAT